MISGDSCSGTTGFAADFDSKFSSWEASTLKLLYSDWCYCSISGVGSVVQRFKSLCFFVSWNNLRLMYSSKPTDFDEISARLGYFFSFLTFFADSRFLIFCKLAFALKSNDTEDFLATRLRCLSFFGKRFFGYFNPYFGSGISKFNGDWQAESSEYSTPRCFNSF